MWNTTKVRYWCSSSPQHSCSPAVSALWSVWLWSGKCYVTRDPTMATPVACNIHTVNQYFSTFVRPRPGKFFFHKTRARSQKIYSSVPFQFFSSSCIKLTQVLIINYGIIIKSITTLICTAWHVDKYKITFKLFIKSRRTWWRGPVPVEKHCCKWIHTNACSSAIQSTDT